MKSLIAFALVLFAGPAFGQESVMERLGRLEQNTASINAMLARQAGDIRSIQEDVKEIREKVDALAASSGRTFTASTVDAWGRGAPASFSSVQTPMMSAGYASYGARRMRLAPVRVLPALRGGCASGN